MRVFLLMLALLGAGPVAADSAADSAAGSDAVARLSVPGMTCPVCPITVRKALTAVPGVTEARVDYDSRSAWVRYDPARVAPAALLQATADVGYPSQLVAPVAGESRP